MCKSKLRHCSNTMLTFLHLECHTTLYLFRSTTFRPLKQSKGCICCIKDLLVTVLWPIHTAEHVSQQLTNMFPDVLVNKLVNISVANSSDVVWCDNFRQQKASDKVLATACVAAFLCPFFFFFLSLFFIYYYFSFHMHMSQSMLWSFIQLHPIYFLCKTLELGTFPETALLIVIL